MELAISIVIPNWNGADLLQAYLPSVETALANYAGQTELIVVDDASTDDSITVLEKLFPRVRVIRHQTNQGFGKACGSGVRAAIHPYIILLNSDVAVAPDFVEPLMRPFEDPDVFAVSPLILDENGKLQDVCINTPYLCRGKIRFKPLRSDSVKTGNPILKGHWFTLFPPGGAFAFDKERFLELEGFDPLFEPFYYEDTDLGFRAWRRGWLCVVAPESRVTHYHNGAIPRSFKHFHIKAIAKRNRLLFLWKNLTMPTLLRKHLVFHLCRFFYAPFCLKGIEIIATLMALPKFQAAMKSRAKERKAAVFGEDQIFGTISAANTAGAKCFDSPRPVLESNLYESGHPF